jgi:formylglycine-generating enzyme required for sulfatase activity
MKFLYLARVIFFGILSFIFLSTASAFDIDKNFGPPKKKKPEAKIAPLEMVFIEGGCFDMGDSFGDGGPDERPVHEVCVDDYYLGTHEVTQGEWEKIMGSIPSAFRFCGKNCPIDLVTWETAHIFIKKLNNKTGLKYRLPTEAEWEYAAKSGGKKEKWAGTSRRLEFEDYAWFKGNNYGTERMTINPVGQKKPNALGLYDMSGNVWEWVLDRYGEDYYSKTSQKLNRNPEGPSEGIYRVYRGGSWSNGPHLLRTSYRSYARPEYRDGSLGFRLARTP